jgi:hypothetical protein
MIMRWVEFVIVIATLAFSTSQARVMAQAAIAQPAAAKTAPPSAEAIAAAAKAANCADDKVYSAKEEKCVPRCAAPLLYELAGKKCTCGAEDKRYDAAAKTCASRCSAPGRFEWKSQTCICPPDSTYDYQKRTCIDNIAQAKAADAKAPAPAKDATPAGKKK